MTETYGNKISPLKAIRAHCLDCVCGSANEVKFCTAKDCSLYPFRFGRNPYINRRRLTEEERAACAERLKNARQIGKNGEEAKTK